MSKLIAHEAPLNIMKEVRAVTDYDYALVHLFEENEEYLKFFYESLSMGRKVLLDNSIFELGVAFSHNRFAYWINQLKPTEYIIPDVLEDCIRTIDSAERWNQAYGNQVSGKRIGVLQGKNYEEVLYCHKKIEKYCDKIAISFNYSFYEKLFPHPNKYMSWMMGRIFLITRLVSDNVIDYSKTYHLLGCSLPQEFRFYQDSKFDFIESIDTSNPVVHGLFEQRYSEEGLFDKKSTPLFTLMNTEVADKQLEDILFNISKFSSLVNS